jgi:hypothetical protein
LTFSGGRRDTGYGVKSRPGREQAHFLPGPFASNLTERIIMTNVSNPFQQDIDARGRELARCLRQVWAGLYPWLLLATPPWVTERYLRLLARCPRRLLVLAEKPWFTSGAMAERLRSRLDDSAVCFRFNDHYLVRGVLGWTLQAPLLFMLGRCRAIKGALLEGPGRVSPAMGVGVLRDVCVHLVTCSHRLFPGYQIRVTRAFAARHRLCAYPTDSYVRLTGVIDTPGTAVGITLEAAKGHPAPRKWLRVVGTEGTLHLDLTADTADHITPNGVWRRLYTAPGAVPPGPPYQALLQRLAAGDETIGLSLHEALKVMQVLEDAARLLPSPLPLYEAGDFPPLPEGDG